MLSTRRLYLIPLATLTVLGATTPAFAGTTTSTAGLSATLTSGSIGSRSITSVLPVALTTALGTSVASGSMSATVTEAAQGGTASWSLSTSSSALLKGGTTSADDIPASNLSIHTRAVTPVNGGGVSTAATGTSPLNVSAGLFTNTGQAVTSLYTGTYLATGTIDLAVPNGQAVGAYTGTLTVTLVQ